MNGLRVLFAAIGWAACAPAIAIAQGAGDPYDALPKAEKARNEAKGVLLHELIYGWCVENVRGEKFTSYSVNPYDETWHAIVGYESTNAQRLSRPRASSDNLTIADLTPDSASCFVQMESESTPLVMRPVVAELEKHFDLLTLVESEDETGRRSRRYLLKSEGKNRAVLIQFHAYYSPNDEVIVAIVQRAPNQ